MILIVVFVENVFIGKVMKKEQIFAVIVIYTGRLCLLKLKLHKQKFHSI